MKLSIFLAQYFYQHKQLNLPTIGTFSLDAAVTVPDPNDKNFREFLKYVQFKQQAVAKPDESLIDYIRTHTGKIRPLAESDLESYLADGKLLLNIGKPFHIDGIGTLTKNKLGIYEFEPGEPTLERFETAPEPKVATEKPAQAAKKSAFDESYSRIQSHHNRRKGVLVGTLVVIGLAVVLWGGYMLYNRDEKGTEAPVTVQPVAADTQVPATTPDTLAIKPPDTASAASLATAPAGSYKFIFETTEKKARALKRHGFLLTLNKNIQLETKDSLTFNISVTLPATPADTTRLKDSLNAWYWGTKPVKVRIAQ